MPRSVPNLTKELGNGDRFCLVCVCDCVCDCFCDCVCDCDCDRSALYLATIVLLGWECAEFHCIDVLLLTSNYGANVCSGYCCF